MATATDEQWADWCETNADRSVAICGTDTERKVRESLGVKWCFDCRARHEFEFVVYVPTGLSYYGPTPAVECVHCGGNDTDLFPGWQRTWGED